MDDLKVEFFPLPSNEGYIEECINLLNEEWPRSKTLRMRSLTSSSNTLPTSFILVVKETTEAKVIGHSRIKSIPSDPDAVFIESVVIGKNYRGRGLGRMLMLETEKFVKGLGFISCFLTTIDKVQFYEKLGYTLTKPVQLYGCFVAKTLQHNLNKKGHSSSNVVNISNSIIDSTSTSVNNIPLAPPLPTLGHKGIVTNGIKSGKIYMKKVL